MKKIRWKWQLRFETIFNKIHFLLKSGFLRENRKQQDLRELDNLINGLQLVSQ